MALGEHPLESSGWARTRSPSTKNVARTPARGERVEHRRRPRGSGPSSKVSASIASVLPASVACIHAGDEQTAGTYGVLGVGTIAEAIVTGLCAGEAAAPDVVLSPRGRARSAALAARSDPYGSLPTTKRSSTRPDTVLICVRPAQAAEVLARSLAARTSVVSVVAVSRSRHSRVASDL